MTARERIIISCVSMTTRGMWAIAPETSMKLVAKGFFGARSSTRHNENDELFSTARQSWVEAMGKRVKVWKWGKGRAVILAHGWGSRSQRMSTFVGPLVSAGYTVVAFDSLGHGESDGRETNFFEFVESIRKVAGHAGDVAGIVAHSMGAAAALNILKAGCKKTRLALIAPLYDLHTGIYEYGKAIGIHPPMYEEMIGRIEREHGRTLHDVSPETIAGRVDCHTLIVHDEDDKVTAMRHSEKLARQMKNARLARTAGLGHGRILDDSVTVDRVVTFIDGD
ncbi:MAG: alpha/beta fold hydrolase [Nitrospinota bacterium]|nr:alpha/beta fold hydrolase [Nitrospinota bacterium]